MANHAGRSGAVYLAIESSTGVATATLSLNAWTLDRASRRLDPLISNVRGC